jgi:hypothetical protein
MSQYIHHVPGRIRVRSKAFRCRSEKARTAERRLQSLAGAVEQKAVEQSARTLVGALT